MSYLLIVANLDVILKVVIIFLLSNVSFVYDNLLYAICMFLCVFFL